jgi:hypothetical protein
MVKTDSTNPETPKASPPVDSGASPPEPQAANPPRKRRGRPFTARTTAPLNENPVGTENAGAAAPPDDQPKQQRRRKSTVDVGALAKNLKGIHALAAKMVPIKGPDGKMLLELDDTEATQLADAVAQVAREYDLELSGKTGAAIQLFGVAAMIYGPRVYVIQQMRLYMQEQKKAADAARRAADDSVVANIPPHANGSTSASAN